MVTTPSLPTPESSHPAIPNEEAKPELPAEIWDQIIRLLRRPLPRPTGRNDRSAIRQPDLVMCMRVSKLFNNLTAPLLYTTIVVDSLPLLVVNLDRSSSAEGIMSKGDLLEYTRGLFLEYSAKDHAAYPSLMANGSLFSTIPPSLSDLETICHAEIREITVSGRQLVGRLNHLETMSCSAYLGPQREVWVPLYTAGGQELESLVHESLSVLEKLGRGISLRGICQRADPGPLSMSTVFYKAELPESCKPLHVTHIDGGQSIGALPLVANARSQWLVGLDPTVDFDAHSQALSVLPVMLKRALRAREQARSVVAKGFAETWAYNIEIFLPLSSTSETLGLANIESSLRVVIGKLLKELKVPSWVSERDKYTVKRIEDAPTCAACGKSNEDLL